MSAVQIIFIDDNYLYENFPIPERMSRANVLSVAQMEQFTSLQDALGSCLYEHLEDAMLNQTLTADEVSLMKLVKYLLAMYTARQLIVMSRTAAAAHTNLDAESHNQYTLDALADSIGSKAKYVQDRLVKFVKGNAAILAIASADGCTNDIFNDTDEGALDGTGVFYPYQPTNNDC